MCNELTWEQEQDIAEYEQWLAERWNSIIDRIIREKELAEEAEYEASLVEAQMDEDLANDFYHDRKYQAWQE